MNTSEVRVRDATQVVVESPTGRPLLSAGASEGILEQNRIRDFISWKPYEIRAYRARNGRLQAHYVGPFFRWDMRTITSLDVLDGDGRILPVDSGRVDVGPSNVTVDLSGECFVHSQHSCDVPLNARLTVPFSNVVEVRHRQEVPRAVGYALLGVSALVLGVGAAALVESSDSSERAIYATIFSVPFVALAGSGLWYLLAPPKEQVWTPPGASP